MNQKFYENWQRSCRKRGSGPTSDENAYHVPGGRSGGLFPDAGITGGSAGTGPAVQKRRGAFLCDWKRQQSSGVRSGIPGRDPADLPNMSQIRVEGNVLRAQAGALLSAIAARAYENSLTGFEFAAGIPGTIGGASVMNAGAYGGEMKDVLRKVTVLSGDGEIFDISKEEMELGYRTSIISKKGYITLEAEIELTPGKQEEIKAVMDDLRTRRTTKQPLEYPSAGSTFKRPEGYFAGKLIQDSGLAGYQVGGAQVSEKHCGFVINKEHATAADIDSLMKQVSAIVKDKFGVTLEPEVKKLGEF